MARKIQAFFFSRGTRISNEFRSSWRVFHAGFTPVPEPPEETRVVPGDLFDPLLALVPVGRVERLVDDGFERVRFTQPLADPDLLARQGGVVALTNRAPCEPGKPKTPLPPADRDLTWRRGWPGASMAGTKEGRPCATTARAADS
jgi:hypothetical protein